MLEGAVGNVPSLYKVFKVVLGRLFAIKGKSSVVLGIVKGEL